MREGIMLCYPYELKRFRSWGNKAFIQPKLDGERCRAIIIDGNVALVSSQGNVFQSVPHIEEALERCFKDTTIELDGELYCHGAPFEEIHSIVSRRVNIHPDAHLMEYHVFDIVSEKSQLDRLNTLDKLILGRGIRKVPTTFVTSEEEIMRCYDSYIENDYEGFILRNIDNAYQRRRSTALLKFKPKKEDVYDIVGYEQEFTIGGQPKDALGALVLSDGDQTFRVGTGFTRDQREYFWKRGVDLIGKPCRIKYQELTSDRGVPRFPVFAEIEG